ncbi:peptide deformylase [Octadecabacter antarcticus 307]|uniref:Peptide deformylase n=1 Tax=Octadecabacter antarcticus 307 TaxID=391626 RepID=M9R0B2_9RHOB|nr:peptide deformylase [Octadecabacter antarcticus]AGI66044.1 peptide deformylase [Octadecabacter antarcticus 307]
MVTRDIRLWPHAVLTQTCAPASLNDPDLDGLIEDLFDTMYHAKGRVLAAPQIGVTKRVFVVDVTWKDGIRDPRAFINPQITETAGDTVFMDEQCLSIPDTPMPVARPEAVQLRWANRDGGLETAPFDGILARCIQHELDHLNGTVIFDHQSPEVRAELEVAYAP